MTATPFTELVAADVSCTLRDVTLLQPTSLRVSPGENVAILGPNGSGKTTFLRVITGNLVPTTGTVTLDGERVDERDRSTRRVIAPLIGPVAGFRDLTIADHLILIDQTWGGGVDGYSERVLVVLDRLGLRSLADRYLYELSSGQRQLVELAMVLIRPSTVLVLDEPEQRLDATRRQMLADILTERVADGASVLWVCHDQDLAERTATRIEHFPQTADPKPSDAVEKSKRQKRAKDR